MCGEQYNVWYKTTTTIQVDDVKSSHVDTRVNNDFIRFID